MNVDIVNISTFGIWSQFGTIKYWFIHLVENSTNFFFETFPYEVSHTYNKSG